MHRAHMGSGGSSRGGLRQRIQDFETRFDINRLERLLLYLDCADCLRAAEIQSFDVKIGIHIHLRLDSHKLKVSRIAHLLSPAADVIVDDEHLGVLGHHDPVRVAVLVDLVPVKKEHLGVEASLVPHALMLLVTEVSMIFLVSEVSLTRRASRLGMMR